MIDQIIVYGTYVLVCIVAVLICALALVAVNAIERGIKRLINNRRHGAYVVMSRLELRDRQSRYWDKRW